MSSSKAIEHILRKTFSIHHLEIIDDSARHAGHSTEAQKGGSHFSVLIVTEDFEGKTLMQRHRAIYKALEGEGIHALAIKALTPKEFEFIPR